MNLVDSWTEWRGQHEPGFWRRLYKTLIVSVFIHLPVSPLMALIGLIQLVDFRRPQNVPDLGEINAIPLDMLENPAGGAKEPEPVPALPADVPVPKLEPKPVKPKPIADAGAPDAAPDAKASASDAGDAGGPLGDPVALSGLAGKIVDSNANVRLVIYTENIRSHPLAPRIGKMLSSIYQWRDFFGPTGLDPVRDIDRILIAGPQLRDSSQVAAVIKYNVSDQRMHQAVDALVQRDTEGGKWLDAGVPAAQANADRAQRTFVMPSPGIVIVTPPSAARSAMSVKRLTFPGPTGAEVVNAKVSTPWRVFIGTPLRIPESIQWAHVQVSPRPDGGIEATIQAEDSSAELAKADAEYLDRAAEALTHIDLGFLGALLGKREQHFVERVSLTSSGKKIYGSVSVNAQQVATLFELLEELVANSQARKEAGRRFRSMGQPPPAPSAAPGIVPSPKLGTPRMEQPPPLPSVAPAPGN